LKVKSIEKNENERDLLRSDFVRGSLLTLWVPWARRSRSPESTSRRGLSERSEFPSHLIRGEGGGTRRAAHGQKWFWALLPKQKCLVGGGETPQDIILENQLG